jgi:hypothetical protein
MRSATSIIAWSWVATIAVIPSEATTDRGQDRHQPERLED